MQAQGKGKENMNETNIIWIFIFSRPVDEVNGFDFRQWYAHYNFDVCIDIDVYFHCSLHICRL